VRKWSISTENDVRQLVPSIRDLRGHDWKAFIGGRDDWDDFCRSMIGYPADYLRLVEEALDVLDAHRARPTQLDLKPIPDLHEAPGIQKKS
jgi:hypothetical protein